MWRTSFVVAASAAVLRGQQPRPYRPAYDALDYAITLDLPDTGALIKANVVLTVARTQRSDTLVLDLEDLTVQRVTVDGHPAGFTRTPTTIAIPIPAKSGARPTYAVSVDYSGAVLDGLIVRKDSLGRWTYFGDNWPNRARHWIASIDHPSDKATVTWRVSAPANRTVVANGKLVSRKSMSGAGDAQRVETVWREKRPIAPYLMVIAAAPLQEYDIGDTACGLAELQRCVPQSVYTAPEQAGFLPGPFARVGDIVRFFGKLVGPFPYEKLAHLQSSTRFGGMENAGAIFYADAGFRDRTMRDGVVAHETAHQWFGDAVTERDWPHLWLSEGFATYFAALWTGEARGDSAFRGDMENIRKIVLADTVSVPTHPVIDTAETKLMALLNRNSYQKGGFVLHMLRKQVGYRAFFQAIRSYYRTHRHATAVSDDLQREMEKASGEKLQWFFDQWLRRPGFPSVNASWTYDAAAREAVITVEQGQEYGTFDFPVTLATVDAAGVMHRSSTRLTREGTARIVRIRTPTPPTRVVIDPDVELLARTSVTRR